MVIESIQMYGIDVQYAPRTIVGEDTIWNEDAISEYNSAYPVEMYVKNVEGFEGEGDFLSKFNIQIRDEITFSVAQRRYREEAGDPEGRERPYEGDLIYFPLTGKIYVIKFVEHEEVFYQFGALQTYSLRCELFEYSNEGLNTGVEEIDRLEELHSTNVGLSNTATLDANGNIVIDPETGRPVGVDDDFNTQPSDDSDDFDVEANSIIDWNETDPFSEG